MADKVIEVDLSKCHEDSCPLQRFIQTGWDGDGYPECSAGQGLHWEYDKHPAHEDCPLRQGRVIIQAKKEV